MQRSDAVFAVVLPQAGALVLSVAMHVFADTHTWWNFYVVAGPVLLVAAFFTGPSRKRGRI